jgi:hypothetical protein
VAACSPLRPPLATDLDHRAIIKAVVDDPPANPVASLDPRHRHGQDGPGTTAIGAPASTPA